TTTGVTGFFSLPTLAGDSIVISAIGYKKRFFRMPDVKEKAYAVLIELKEDVTLLPTVEIFPYPTEEAFKDAFLTMQLPDEKEYNAVRKNLDQELLTRMMYESLTPDPQANYRYVMNQSQFAASNRNFYRSNPLLNPIAWAQFIKSVKRGDLKKKKWKE
ncbi:MAG: carboxypeptidase-like regulatory domain-containing protein, partial [Verrucomicrobia bacterium]|nr:carboxypeptidase-like regulatory domain-containing protein [Cytophagales bacterium]